MVLMKRDGRFIAEHLGGPLKKAQHIQLLEWACTCIRHAQMVLEINPDDRLSEALEVAANWACGTASTGNARDASIQAIAIANEARDPISVALARAVGHTVASAHMADHVLAAVWYALKAIHFAEKSIEEERIWQNQQLHPDIRELVLSAREMRNI
jgi:hypothetical protein